MLHARAEHAEVDEHDLRGAETRDQRLREMHALRHGGFGGSASGRRRFTHSAENKKAAPRGAAFWTIECE